jgi:hypothetical protein
MTRDEAKKLGKGHAVVFKSGDPESEDFIHAKAVLVRVGMISCTIKITDIFHIGTINDTKVGDQKIVSYDNLEIVRK